MFGGGAKKEKKEDDDDRGDNSGSAKAQREAAAAAKDGDDVSGPEIPRTLVRQACLLRRLISPTLISIEKDFADS